MIGVTVKVKMDLEKLRKGSRAGILRSISHAAATVRKIAIHEIEKYPRGVASAAGTPIHTHRHDVPRAILYAVEGDHAVIGTSFTNVGLVGQPHEHGGMFRGRMYPARPFMSPALEILRPELTRFFANSIKGD